MDKFNELINGEKPVLVDFFATWCGPCKMMHPILENVKKRLGDKVIICRLTDNRCICIISSPCLR